MNNKIFFILFIIVWIGLVILNIFNPKILFSEQENRMLAQFPTFSFEKLINGEYAKQMDTYINDHFIFRNSWIKIKSQWEKTIGKTENNDVYIGDEGYLFEKFEYGSKQQNNLKTIAIQVNQLAQKSNVPTSFLLIPNSIYIMQDKLPDYAITYNQEEIIQEFYNQLENVNKVDVTKTLIAMKNKDLYFKTDHHMTSTGAYVTYYEWKKSKGELPIALSNYTSQIVSDEFLGTFDSKAQILGQEKDKIEIYFNEKNTNLREVIYDNEITNSIFNEEYLSKKDKYSYFLNGNNARVIVKTNNINGKKLLVIKDSYAHIFAQFLCQDYEEIHFIDPRYYKLSMVDYINQNDISETLFLYNVSNIVDDIGLRGIGK